MTVDGIVVLSLFDGMSCGQLALQKLGVPVKKYYACEIDKHAVKFTSTKWAGMIHLGSVVDVHAKDLPKIDIIIGGSPCQGFSNAGKGLNFNDPRSMLFFEYVRLLKECRERNPDVLFLLENVRMKKEWEDIISRVLGIQPIFINSALLSAQNRERLYWTNIGMKQHGLFGDNYCSIPQPKDKEIYLRDILELEVNEKYYLTGKAIASMKKRKQKNVDAGKVFGAAIRGGDDKSPCISARYYKDGSDCLIKEFGNIKFDRSEEGKKIRRENQRRGKDYNPFQAKEISGVDFLKMSALTTSLTDYNLLADPEIEIIRRLTPIEVCRLQTVPDDYFFDNTCGGGQMCSDTQIYRMCGNGWTVDVIGHILSFAKF